MSRVKILFLIFLLCTAVVFGAGNVLADMLKSADTVSGYVARLLINESAFPGEHGWVSEADSKGAMLAILWVLESRINHVPEGYTQQQVAAVRSKDIIDVITTGGEKGQCDGFYRDKSGRFVAVPRVERRLDNLITIAGTGEPGKFVRLLEYAQGLADAYVQVGIEEADRFAGIRRIGTTDVTGRAYSWMTNQDYYSPGGFFVKIPDSKSGSMAGNRFFTLKDQ